MGIQQTQSSLVFCGIAPHPPIMVPEVGGEAIVDVRNSIDAMAELTQRVIRSGAKTVVLISPHAPLEADSFVAYAGPSLNADFANFRAPETEFQVEVDEQLLDGIEKTAAADGYHIDLLHKEAVDHGTAVPLYFLLTNGWHGKVVALGYSFLTNEDHLNFGKAIRNAIHDFNQPVAFIASGDLSHRLKPQAPAGYNPHAYLFDEEVVDAIRSNDVARIVQIDPSLRRLAGECGYRSMLVAIGALEHSASAAEVLSYEAPFGVGYLVAQLVGSEAVDRLPNDDLPGLARLAVESFVRNRKSPPPPSKSSAYLQQTAPCFVCLKTVDGELRGCIGTIEPAKSTLAEEILANAISAATLDPRFRPVEEHELVQLRYSVDVLLPPESAELNDLDPKTYGVIVEDTGGLRRGLLLPDIPGVDTAEEQVQIAARKAGIPHGTPMRLSRFKVERFREASDASNTPS